MQYILVISRFPPVLNAESAKVKNDLHSQLSEGKEVVNLNSRNLYCIVPSHLSLTTVLPRVAVTDAPKGDPHLGPLVLAEGGEGEGTSAAFIIFLGMRGQNCQC